MFKMSTDIYGLYRGDENAMKVAGHDIKGLESYFYCQVPELNFPLVSNPKSVTILDVCCRLHWTQNPSHHISSYL